MNTQDHIEKLKTAADPYRVAVALGLQNRGRRFFCPSCQPHGGKTPDLVVGDKGFICHKCGTRGDLLTLIQVAGKMDFPSAVAWLEKETGIEPPERKKRGYQDKGRTEIVHPGPFYEAEKRKATGPTSDPAVYQAFLDACRPVDGPVLTWLTKVKGVKKEVVIDLGLRFCGREYADIMDTLEVCFGKEALHGAGLLKRNDKGRLVPSFWHYFASKAGFLVIPYMKDGRPAYLKVRPPVGKIEAERRKLVRFMNTGGAIPCLYNVDALKGRPEKVLICEGESDTWTALSYGYAAVGSPGAKAFKETWVEAFRSIESRDGRSGVILVLDADKAGGEGERVIADLFLKAGLPVPLKLVLPPGMDLTDYMKEGRNNGRFFRKAQTGKTTEVP